MLVLTVDDSDINLALYRSLLSRLPDVTVVMQNSPLAALEWLKTRTPDVVILDYHMPELDGVGFIKRMREDPVSRDVLIVMVTADAERDVRLRALEAGATDFLNKPIDGLEFTTRTSNLLALAKSRRQLADRAEWLREEVEHATATMSAREVETVLRLTRAAEFRDDVTGMHVIRVGQMCAALGRTIGLPYDDCRMLLLAAPMHDIGKVATPDAILLKPGPLDADEFEIIKQHPLAGYEILKGSESPMLQCAAEIALTHHERWDGSGYPYGLKGNEIPLNGRLCAIADVYDALTSVRPYKVAWPVELAVQAIDDGRGKHFDPEVVDLFHATFDEITAIKRQYAESSVDITGLEAALATSHA